MLGHMSRNQDTKTISVVLNIFWRLQPPQSQLSLFAWIAKVYCGGATRISGNEWGQLEQWLHYFAVAIFENSCLRSHTIWVKRRLHLQRLCLCKNAGTCSILALECWTYPHKKKMVTIIIMMRMLLMMLPLDLFVHKMYPNQKWRKKFGKLHDNPWQWLPI